MSNLATYRLGDIATFVNGRAYSMPEMLLDGKYRIVRVGNFTGKDEWYYSNMELDADKYCENGDLLYKWACTFGPEIWTEEKAIYHYHIWKVIPNEKYISKDYLYYLLSFMTNKWMKAAHGSTMVHITKEIMESNIVTIPVDINEQRLVAAQLKAIDAKINNNTAIAAELEGMAKDLYDYWFVQFDFPDENGKPYKSSGGKMVWNEELKREIPKGWETSELKHLCKYISEKNSENCELGKYITTDNMLQNMRGIEILDAIPSAISTAMNFQKRDILVSNIRPYFKKIWFASFEGKASTDVLVIRAKNGVAPEYLYQTLARNAFFDYVMNGAKGSKMPRGDKDHIMQYKVVIPPRELVQRAIPLFKNSLEQKALTQTENADLASLRDFLLPMLMNGQVQVKGA